MTLPYASKSVNRSLFLSMHVIFVHISDRNHCEGLDDRCLDKVNISVGKNTTSKIHPGKSHLYPLKGLTLCLLFLAHIDLSNLQRSVKVNDFSFSLSRFCNDIINHFDPIYIYIYIFLSITWIMYKLHEYVGT